MRVIELALKDLRQIGRDRKAALFLVIMPLIFTAFLSLMSGGMGTSGDDQRLKVGWVNNDGSSIVTTELRGMLDASELVRPVNLTTDEAAKAREMVRDAKLAAVVIVPAGYNQQFLAGNTPKLTVIYDAANSVSLTASNALQATDLHLRSALEIARLSTQTGASGKDEATRQAYFNEAFSQASAAWHTPPLAIKAEQSNRQNTQYDPYAQMSPGILVQFVIYGLMSSAMILVLERKTRTLSRMLTTPIKRWEIVAGHLLAMFLVVLGQEVILIGFGQLVFGVNYLREPLAILLIMVTLGLWVSALGLFISAMSKAAEQVTVWSLVAMFVLCVFGGCWFPLEITGPVFAAIGHLTPAAWAMEGFQNIIVRNLGFSSALLPSGMLLVFAFAFFGAAVWRFKFE